MKPCVKCPYSALCLALGGAYEVAEHLVHNGSVVNMTSYDVLKYADGTPAPVRVNIDSARFYRSRPKDCPGRQE